MGLRIDGFLCYLQHGMHRKYRVLKHIAAIARAKLDAERRERLRAHTRIWHFLGSWNRRAHQNLFVALLGTILTDLVWIFIEI